MTMYKKARLISNIKSNIRSIALNARATTVVWSNILPRLNWGTLREVTELERTRKDINRFAAHTTLQYGGAWVKHVEITADCLGLFRSDGIHLSAIGLDILLSSFKETIEYCVNSGPKTFLFD